MYQAIGIISLLGGAAALIWFVLSAICSIVPRWKVSGKRHMKRAIFSFGAAILGLIIGLQFEYKDWGLADPSGLPAAKAAYQQDQEAKTSKDKADKYAAAVVAREAEAREAAEKARLLVETQKQEAARKLKDAQAAEEAKRCGIGNTVAVKTDYDLRSAASETADRIVNEKATSILKKTHYQQVDPSTTVKIIGCTEDWSQINITEPSWLNFVQGWVPNDVLRGIDRSADGTRVYVEDDMYWDKDTSKFKPQIVAMINKLSRERTGCSKLDPGSVTLSPSKSKPRDPVFFVTCDPAGTAFNVWFRPTDIGKTVANVAPIGKGDAALACETEAKAQATHPSTVDFSHFLDVAYSARPDGRVALDSSFTAKNSFNLELKYRIRCLFDGMKLIEATVIEDRG
ncbi:hypothetical protein G6L09_11560 [Agrobacterium rhizogenes]|nr:hypothetical protein [Rhizobium rhizogenes]NTH71191.1 hypothetical protein [Rhizobium rhizogenes]